MSFKSGVVKSGKANVVAVAFNTVLFELEIDPDAVSSQDDKYTLFCSDNKSIYNETKTVKDDNVPGDDFLTLKFTKLISDHNYTLEIDPGAEGEPYYLFENVPLEDLLSDRFSYAGSEDEDDPELEHFYDESEDQDLPYNDPDPDDEELPADEWPEESDGKHAEEWEQESDDAYSDADEEEDEGD
jgi:hypothetical protein